MYCDKFSGGFCEIIKTNVPRSWCLDRCRLAGIEPSEAIKAAPRPPRQSINKAPAICNGCQWYHSCGFCRLLTRHTNLVQYLGENPCPLVGKPKLEPPEIKIEPAKKCDFIFKRSNGRVADITNIFKGQSAFLCCNGPSFSAVDKGLLRRAGILTMGVNNGACREDFRPDLWTAQDPPNKFLPSIWKDPKIMKFTLLDYRLKRLKDHSTGKLTNTRLRDCPNLFFHRRHSEFRPERWFSEKKICWGRPKKGGGNRSTMMAAMQILWLLGISRIYLLGVDFKMSKEEKYFFDEDRSGPSIRGNNRLFENMAKYFTQLLPYMKANKLEIFNCNPDSGLRVFPFKDIAEAVAENQIILNENTRGMYAKK